MLLWLLHRLPCSSGCRHWRALGKITLRASLAAMVSFLLAVLLGPRLIAWLRRPFPRADQERLARGPPPAPGQAGHAHDGRPVHRRRTDRRHAPVGRPGQPLRAAGAVGGRRPDARRRRRRPGQAPHRRPTASRRGANWPANSSWPSWPPSLLYRDHAALADGLVLPPPLGRDRPFARPRGSFRWPWWSSSARRTRST